MAGKKVASCSQLANEEIQELRQQNKDLNRDLLAQMSMQDTSLSDALYMYCTMPLPLLAGDWELGYAVLGPTSLRWYKRPEDRVFHAREEVILKGCVVEWEGLLRDGHWSFSVTDAGGSSLIRLSAKTERVAEKWVNALAARGCDRREAGSATVWSEPAPAGSPMHRATSLTRLCVHSRRQSATGNMLSTKEDSAPSSPTQDGHADASSTTNMPSCSPRPPPPMLQEEAEEASLTTPPRQNKQQLGPMMGSTPVHTSARWSYLSSERQWHENFTGLYNLAGVVLIATNFRLALENALKYGWRYNPIRSLSTILSGNGNGYIGLCYVAIAALCVFALALEKIASYALSIEMKMADALVKKHDISEREAVQMLTNRMLVHEWSIFVLNTINTMAVFGIPWAVIYHSRADPVPAFALVLLAIICWMKLVSWHHCNWDLRLARRTGELRPGERGSPDSPVEWALHKYPDNLVASNFFYFLAAPTLTYQINYPRSSGIRMKWLARRVFELAIVLTFMAYVISQYIEPAVMNSMQPLQEMHVMRLVERVLKLSLPCLYCWLAMFYSLFHLWLNILAELLRFGDREFYKDWWNAATVGEYWKLWNMPVHKWLLRHVYFPCIRYGVSRFWAMVVVFWVSAVFHELLLGVPLHMVRFWAFSGIMFQVPLVILSEKIRRRLNRDDWGNLLFWVSFCVVGQPVCVLFYYHDYRTMSMRHAALTAPVG